MSKALQAFSGYIQSEDGKAAADDHLDFRAARHRLRGYTSILASLSDDDRRHVLSCDEPEVAGNLRRGFEP